MGFQQSLGTRFCGLLNTKFIYLFPELNIFPREKGKKKKKLWAETPTYLVGTNILEVFGMEAEEIRSVERSGREGGRDELVE